MIFLSVRQGIQITALMVAALLIIAIDGSAQDVGSGKVNHFIPFSISDSVNSNYDELNPVLTPDGNTIFFSRLNHPDNHYGAFDSQDIWFSEKQSNGEWGKPLRLNARFNEGRYNALYSISDNWECLISGQYAGNGRYKKRGLSTVKYDSTLRKWLNPVKVKVPKYSRKNRGIKSSAYLSKSGKVLVLSYSQYWQDDDIPDVRISLKKSNGKWSSPKKAKNRKVDDYFKSIEAPYLSDNDSILYFSAYYPGKINRDQNNIFKIYRLDNSFQNWSDPEQLDDTINTDDWESGFRLFDDDNWAMFSRGQAGSDANIYFVKLHEPRPYIDLSGLVLLEGEPMKEDFQVVINGEVVDSVRINADSSTYAVHLPFGDRYEIHAKAFEREAKIEIIDATDQLEYLKVDRDLQLSLLPFLDLSGVVKVNDEPLTDPFQIIINGNAVDSVQIDTLTGEYSVKLPLGLTYNVYVSAENYIPDTALVNVLYDSTQIQLRKDLSVSPIPYVDIFGDLINPSTDSLLPQSSNPKFVLNGVVTDSISTSDGHYNIRLPWGYKYTFQVQADDFDPVVATIDLQNVKNYQKIEKNLYATPLERYARVSGKVIDKKTGLPYTGDFLIDVDGAHSTTSKVNIGLGSYEVKLSLGKKSVLTASAESYFPIAEVVDVTNETETVTVTKDLIIVPLRVGETILLNNITFGSGSSTLTGDSFSDMDRVVDLLKAFPNLKIEIAGHTDSSGNDGLNMRLSRSRAQSVSEYIIGHGISKERVVFKGYGETKPVATNLTPGGRAQNRRVEFVVLEL